MDGTPGSGRSLASGFLRSTARFPERPAIAVDGRFVSYGELGRKVATLAACIAERVGRPDPLVGVLAQRSETAYTGVLAALTAGCGYVPLNPRYPPDRLRRIVERAGTRLIVAGTEGEPVLEKLLEGDERGRTVILPDWKRVDDLQARFSGHRFATVHEPDGAGTLPEDLDAPADGIAYLMFTSGSTGEPKGVPVSHGNAIAYVEHMRERMGADEHDRFSQMHDLSFDFSVHDLWVAWEAGACVCCVPERSVFAPARFIRDHAITAWASVPSVVALMRKLGMLKEGAFPSLRRAVFCGEPLPGTSAEAWQRAAPGCVIENIYGPTEATVAITGYPWDQPTSPEECHHGIVPIGWPFPGQQCRLVDENGDEVPTGSTGELCLSGSQVTAGYWKAPGLTAVKYTRLREAGDVLWYRTGDLAWTDDRGCIHFAGRIDHQVKIRGHRAELQEIEHRVREAAACDQVAAVAWPFREGSADGVVAFVSGCRDVDDPSILRACRKALPEYMVPDRIVRLAAMPLNRNGKVDRAKLLETLEEEAK